MDFSTCYKTIDNISKVIVGKQKAVQLMIVAILADGHDFTLPDDVKALARPVLAHRLILNENEQLRGENPTRL